MNTISAREIVGKRIVAYRPGAYRGGRGEMAKTMHQPEIELEDGSVLVFQAEEHPDALEYGISVLRRKPVRRTRS